MNKQTFIDNLIDNYYAAYSKLLVFQLKEAGFSNRKYVVPTEIISICNISINCIINTFEAIVTNLLTSFKDVKEFIHIYSQFSNPTEKKQITFRQACRYIIYLLPKLKLSSKPTTNSKEYNMNELCKLITLSKLLQSFIQAKAIQVIESSSCVSISIDSFVIIEYTSERINTINKAVYNSCQPIHKNYSSEEKLNSLLSIIDKFSPAISTIFDYTSQLMNRRADIFEITREIQNCNNDPIVSGLLYSSENVNLSEAIHSPYNTFYRTRFRPFLQLNIDGKIHYYSTPWMIMEAFDEISTNLIPYGELPKDWEKVHELKLFCKTSKSELGKSFEDEVFKIINPRYKVNRNISGFHNISLKKESVPGTTRKVGEIDFILIDYKRKVVYVIDAKCTKTKFYFQTFNKDKSTFENYSVKLKDKVQWVSLHKSEVGKYFKMTNIEDYSVKGIFVTNSLIYYSFFSEFPIIPLDKLINFIEASDRMCVV